MLRTDDLWCQMFSEPGAGSDLAGLVTSAVRDGDEWVLNGQKVWTSGAQFADWGYILCRTDPSLPKHRGLTAFIVSMSAPGLEVRPLRQMTGGSSFNEVFFNDVRVPDGDRLGAPGHGWRVALTTLGFERTATGVPGGMRTVGLLMTLARRLCRDEDPVVRELLACAYCRQRISDLSDERAKAALRSGETPGPEGSIGKLYRSETLRAINEAASVILGPRLLADTGEWGTYTWTEHLLGTAGARIAGGSDEIQRNILGERLLGLPGEPRVDRDVPFRDVPH
jgi:alkylation response protein AidB-like acyl-CoA dehydrogenase